MKKCIGSLRIWWILLAELSGTATARTLRHERRRGSVEVIDPETNKVVQVIEGIEGAMGLLSPPDGSRAYITDEAEMPFAVVDTKTAKVIKMVSPQRSTKSSRGHQRRKRVLVCIREKTRWPA